MKNRLLLVAIASFFSAFCAAAQPAPTEPRVFDSSSPDRLVELNIHAAVGMSSAINNYKSVVPSLTDLQFSPGVMLRGGLTVDFSLRNSLAIGTGIEVDINNSRCALSLIDSNTSSINSIYLSNHYYDLNIPVYMSLRFNVGRRVKNVVSPGWYFSYGLGGHMKASGYTSGQNSLGQAVVDHVYYKNDYFDAPSTVMHSIKSLDYGPRLAVGVEYCRHYTFNWVFQMSARNLAKNNELLNVRYRHITLGFEIGYKF